MDAAYDSKVIDKFIRSRERNTSAARPCKEGTVQAKDRGREGEQPIEGLAITPETV
jgi:hypothetical protein